MVLLQRALLNDSASMAEAQERLRRLLDEAEPVPTQADAGDGGSTYKDQRNVRRLTVPGPGAPGRRGRPDQGPPRTTKAPR